VSPLQPTRGPGGASWALPAGSGAEPWPKTGFGVFWRPQNALFCTYMTKIWEGQFALASPTPNSGGTCPPHLPWSTPMAAAQLTKHKRLQQSFELSKGDVRLPKLLRHCSTALARRCQNNGHWTGCVTSWPVMFGCDTKWPFMCWCNLSFN